MGMALQIFITDRVLRVFVITLQWTPIALLE